MGHYLTTAAPAWAIVTWVDDNWVYTQIPSTKGEPPFIQKYPLTSTGLGSALALMREIHREQNPPGLGHAFTFEGRKPRKIPAKGKAKQPVGTPEQRELARRVLKKLGIL